MDAAIPASQWWASAHSRRYTGDRVKRTVIEPADDLVEEVGSFGLSVFGGVVALPGEDGQELGAGAEVGAGFAG
jgi:hypothetical protein